MKAHRDVFFFGFIAAVLTGSCSKPSGPPPPPPDPVVQRPQEVDPPISGPDTLTQDPEDPLTVRKEFPTLGELYLLSRAAKDILVAAKDIELFSLDPTVPRERGSGNDEDAGGKQLEVAPDGRVVHRGSGNDEDAEGKQPPFEGWRILGSTKVTDQGIHDRLVTEIDDAVGVLPRGFEKLCFEPRHGVRATSGGHTVELVICFTCSQIHIYVDGHGVQNVTTIDTPQNHFDDLLRAAKVPVAPKRMGDKSNHPPD